MRLLLVMVLVAVGTVTPSGATTGPSAAGRPVEDSDVPPSLTLRFHDQSTENRQEVTLKVYPEEDHSGTVLASLPDSRPLLAAQLR